MVFLKKRWEAFLVLLKDGITPHKIALGIAGGIVIGTFPVIGPTTFLCFVFAWFTRVNTGIVQFANYATYPLQIICLIPLYRTGAYLSGLSFDTEKIQKINSIGSLADFLKESGILIYYTIGAWLGYGSLAGFLIYGITYILAARSLVKLRKSRLAGESIT
jgi:uncharacterized protein (DUF2062 family)